LRHIGQACGVLIFDVPMKRGAKVAEGVLPTQKGLGISA
jgi:hypothetical protein